jgi:hypothetical protein
MNRLDIERVRQEMRWQTIKALAVILMAIVACAGIIFAVAHIMR